MHSSRMRSARSLPYGGLPDKPPPPPWPETQRPSPVNRITDRCKNISFPQLRLRAVSIEVFRGKATTVQKGTLCGAHFTSTFVTIRYTVHGWYLATAILIPLPLYHTIVIYG